MMPFILSLLILVPISIMGALATIGILFENEANPIYKVRWAIASLVGMAVAGYLFSSFSETSFLFDTKNVSVQYRESKVDISKDNFESFVPKTKGENFNGAWYDKVEKYMIIRLGDKYYHYCGLTEDAWSKFKEGEVPQYGKGLTYMHYNEYIRGSYDCRAGYIPSYSN